MLYSTAGMLCLDMRVYSCIVNDLMSISPKYWGLEPQSRKIVKAEMHFLHIFKGRALLKIG